MVLKQLQAQSYLFVHYIFKKYYAIANTSQSTFYQSVQDMSNQHNIQSIYLHKEIGKMLYLPEHMSKMWLQIFI